MTTSLQLPESRFCCFADFRERITGKVLQRANRPAVAKLAQHFSGADSDDSLFIRQAENQRFNGSPVLSFPNDEMAAARTSRSASLSDAINPVTDEESPSLPRA